MSKSGTGDLPKHPIIVIGRQTGSRGRELARILAQRLGMSYYDKELLSQCARRHGYLHEIFQNADERKPSFFRSFLHARFGLGDALGTPLSGESIYRAQSEVMRQLADEGPAVFVGRTADYVLREYPTLTSVFIHAPLETRVAEVLARGDAKTREDAAAYIKRADSSREDYYNYFTGRNWGKADNYHLAVDSSKFSQKALVEMICEISRAQE